MFTSTLPLKYNVGTSLSLLVSLKPGGILHQQSQNNQSIVFASIAAGGSHMSTAHAMREAVEREFPEKYSIQVLDVMKDYGFSSADAKHKLLWKYALANPWSIVVSQHMIDSAPIITNSTIKVIIYEFARAAAARLKEQKPDLIVANHGWTVVAMTMAQKRFGLDVPVVSFETSTLNANALWADRDAERFIVGSAISKRRLSRLGIPIERIDVVGYPVRQAFLDAPNKSEARERIGIDDRFTAIISLGGEGIGGQVTTVLDALKKYDDRVQTVLIAGRNRALFREVSELSRSWRNLHVRGFVHNMADYVAASDVVIGKTGPAATYEILAVGRPMLVPSKTGLAENKMLRILERNGVGWHTPYEADISTHMQNFLDNPDALTHISAISRGFDFPGMATRIARYLDGYATNRTVPHEICDQGLRFQQTRSNNHVERV